MNQASLALKTKEPTTNQRLLALSWNIATEPKLYRQLASNPFSPQARQAISERFPNTMIEDVIHSVILAEPEGKYDRAFRLLNETQQKNELKKQKNESDLMNDEFAKYCKKYASQLDRLTQNSLYNRLSRVVFKLADNQEIEQRYSQNQRQYFRLLIMNYIESRNGTASKKRIILPLMHGTFTLLVLLLVFYLAYNLYAQYVGQQKQIPKVNAQVLEFTPQKENQIEPVRLIIPSLNVDSNIQHIGLTSNGEMDVPSDTVDVGWYKLGPIPGVRGSAVISGHFDGRDGKYGVFDNLDKLAPGDKIYIINELKEITTFVVRESRIYNPGYADEVFLPNDDGVHLNLITCDGTWDNDNKSYSHRLVVFSDIAQ